MGRLIFGPCEEGPSVLAYSLIVGVGDADQELGEGHVLHCMQVHFSQVLLNGIQILLELRMLVKRSSRLV